MRTTVLVHWRSLLFRVCLNWVEKMWMSCLRWFVIVTGYCCRDADDCFHVCSTNGGCFANKQQVEELHRRLFGSMSMIEEMNGVCCREGQPSADHCHGRRFTKDGSNRKHNFFESDVHCGSRFSLEIVDKAKRKRNWQDVVLRAAGTWNNSCLIPSWEDNKKNLSCCCGLTMKRRNVFFLHPYVCRWTRKVCDVWFAQCAIESPKEGMSVFFVTKQLFVCKNLWFFIAT